MKKSIVDFADDELGRHVKQRHNHLATLHAAGLHHTHPAEQWNADSKVLRDNRDSLPENVASSKPIELEGGPAAEQALDDPAPTPNTPKVHRPGTPTMDSMERLVPGYGRLGGGGKTFTYDREEDGVTLKTTGRLR